MWREENPRNDRELAERWWEAVVQSTGNPLLVDFLAKLIEKANIPARDPAALARAVQLYSARKIKFFRERPERFQHPLRTLVWGIGDCDDKGLFVAASLRSFRIPIRGKFLKLTIPLDDGTQKQVGHVYPLAHLGGKWVALESVREKPMGYDPEIKARKRGYGVDVFTIGDKPDALHA